MDEVLRGFMIFEFLLDVLFLGRDVGNSYKPLSLHSFYNNVHIAQNNQYTKVAYLGWHNVTIFAATKSISSCALFV